MWSSSHFAPKKWIAARHLIVSNIVQPTDPVLPPFHPAKITSSSQLHPLRQMSASIFGFNKVSFKN
jgi:hypothetical protein